MLTCRQLVTTHHLDKICILEAKIPSTALSDDWFVNSHLIFSNKESCNNVFLLAPRWIWVKLNPCSISFYLSFVHPLLIHGMVSIGYGSPFCLSIIYAANSPADRNEL